MDMLRASNDALEKKMASELDRALGAQTAQRRELDELRAKVGELQRDLEQANQQKAYVTDAFETSRKESSKLRADNAANLADVERLRRMLSELQAEHVQDQTAQRAVLADLQQLELENDMLGRALGAATKQLFGKQQAAAAAAVDASPAKGRPAPAVKKALKPAPMKALARGDSPARTPARSDSPRHTVQGARRQLRAGV